MRHTRKVEWAGCLMVAVALVPARSSAAAASLFEPLPSMERRMVEAVRLGAMRRLRSSTCRKVLTDFKDAQGRTPLQNLEPYALTPEEYMDRILFFDGVKRRVCRTDQTQLVAFLGADKNVYVCRPFLQTLWKDRTMAEMYVIHEMLHTLGVGENPPTSVQITHQVMRRCAQ